MLTYYILHILIYKHSNIKIHSMSSSSPNILSTTFLLTICVPSNKSAIAKEKFISRLFLQFIINKHKRDMLLFLPSSLQKISLRGMIISTYYGISKLEQIVYDRQCYNIRSEDLSYISRISYGTKLILNALNLM